MTTNKRYAEFVGTLCFLAFLALAAVGLAMRCDGQDEAEIIEVGP